MIRNVRRGSASDAALALQRLGSEAIVEELLLDRVARSGVAPAASVLNAWQKIHDLAFQHSSEPVPMIPVTVRSLVLTGLCSRKAATGPIQNTCQPSRQCIWRPIASGPSYLLMPVPGLPEVFYAV